MGRAEDREQFEKSLRWLATQQRLGRVGQAPETESEWRVAVGQVLERLWLEQRGQANGSVEVVGAALLIWLQYIEPGLYNAVALSRGGTIEALCDRARVMQALGVSNQSELLRPIMGTASTWRSRDGGQIQPAKFRAAQEKGLQWWLDALEREYLHRFTLGQLAHRRAGTIDRPELWRAIGKGIRHCRGSGRPLVLLGPPGAGKTTLFELIAANEEMRREFPQGARLIKLGPELTAPALSKVMGQVLLPGVDLSAYGEAALKPYLQQVASSKRMLFLLDDCCQAEHAQVVLDIASPDSLVIVNTRMSQVVRSLAPSEEYVIRVPGFSVQELESYYVQVWDRFAGESALQNLRELWRLMRGNPLGLQIALHHVAQQGWDTTLSVLREPPLPTPEGVVDDLYRPLHLAYQSLSTEARACFRRLGALPELRSYDLALFAALWQVNVTGAIGVLDKLHNDAGLLQPVQAGEVLGWELHQQVLNYAGSLLAQEPVQEQRSARQWTRRMLQTDEQRQRFERLLREAPRYSFVDLMRWRRITRPFIKTSAVWRGLKRLWNPGYVSDWEMFKLLPVFSSEDYVLAAQLRRGEINFNLWGIALIVSILIAGIVGVVLLVGLRVDVEPYKLFGVWLVFWVALALKGWLGVRAREVLWLQLWEKAIEQLESTADAPDEDVIPD